MKNISITSEIKTNKFKEIFKNIIKIKIFKKRVRKNKVNKFAYIYDKDLFRKEVISLGFVPKEYK